MQMIESHCADNASGYLFHCEDSLFNLRNILFSGGSVDNNIVNHLVYGIFKLHVHEYSLYYDVTYGI